MNKLAFLGGDPVIKTPFSPYNFIGEEEFSAVEKVMRSGVLSGYVGAYCDAFYGGPWVRDFEKAWSEHFNVRHSIAVNSNTSGLIAALGAVGISPGDEVIVSTWSMCASATAILIWNAIPVFADIDPQTFNLDPDAIERAITPYTKAIMVPDIFGHPADLNRIMKIAKAHRLVVIEDCAQAPGALYQGKYAGTVADIGVYSLNYHKHIHTGEGGVCVTDNNEYAERMQLIRNHAEAVVEKKGVSDLSNMIGFNFRLTELQAAIGIEQLKKLEKVVEYRCKRAKQLIQGLSNMPGLSLPITKPGCTHVYYTFPLTYDASVTGVPRDQLIDALKAEGVSDVAGGYVNIHRYPMYQKRIAYGNKGYPWTADFYQGNVSYDLGICPIAEKLHDHQLINFLLCLSYYTEDDMNQVIRAFKKVWGQLDELRVHSDCLA